VRFSLAIEQCSTQGGGYEWMEGLLEGEGSFGKAEERFIEMVELIILDEKESFHKQLSAIIPYSAVRPVWRLFSDYTALIQDRKKRSLLHLTAQLEACGYTEALLEAGFSPIEEDDKGFIPLHYAAMEGKIEQMTLLLKADPSSFDHQSSYGSTPLIVAIEHGQTKAVEKLLSKGASMKRATHRGYTPFLSALHEGKKGVIDLLLLKVDREDVNVKTGRDVTPLMLAASLDAPTLIEKLVDLGANCDAENKKGEKALNIALQCSHYSLVALLIKKTKPTSILARDIARYADLELGKEWLSDIDLQAEAYRGLAQEAIYKGNPSLALYCVKEGPKEMLYQTVLPLAIRYHFFSVVQEIMKQGAFGSPKELLNLLCAAGDKKSLDCFCECYARKQPTKGEVEEALHTLLHHKHLHLLSSFLEKSGLKIETQRFYKEKWAALHMVARANGRARLKQVINKHPNLLLSPTKEGKTLAYIAAEAGSELAFDFLHAQMREQKLSLEKQYGDRHLFYPIFDSFQDHIIERLLKEKDNLSLSLNSQGKAPIHWIAQMGRVDLLKNLKESGVNLTSCDKEGCSPLTYAIRAGNLDAITFLLDAGVAVEEKALAAARLFPPLAIREQILEAIGHPHLEVAFPSFVDGEDLNGNTKLFYAIQEGNLSKALRLLEEGADSNHRNHQNITPFALALHKEKREMISALLPHCDLDRYYQIPGKSKLTPLEALAIHYPDSLFLEALTYLPHASTAERRRWKIPNLIAGGGNVTAMRHLLYRESWKAFFFRAGVEVMPWDLAAYDGNLEMVKLFLKEIPDLQRRGSRMLFHAALGAQRDVARFLINKGFLDPLDKEERVELLDHAFLSNCKESIKLFCDLFVLGSQSIERAVSRAIPHVFQEEAFNTLDYIFKELNFPIESQLEDGRSILHAVSERGSFLTIKWLIEEGGGDPRQKGPLKEPLHYAVRGVSLPLFRYLLEEAGAMPEDKSFNEGDETLLHLAAKRGTMAHNLLLLEKGYDPNARDSLGATPLSFAAARSDWKLVELLLFAGADEASIERVKQKHPLSKPTVEAFEQLKRDHPGESLLQLAMRAKCAPASALLKKRNRRDRE